MSNHRANLAGSQGFLPPSQFFSLLQSKLRSSLRNKSISKSLSSSQTKLAEQVKNLKMRSHIPIKKADDVNSLNQNDLFMWFLIKKRKMRDLIPDIEFLKYREICLEMISTLGSCCEAHFGLGIMYAHEANFDTALQHIRIALSDNKNDKTYNLWHSVLTAFRVNSKKRALQAKKVCHSNLHIAILKSDPRAIEVLWALMQLSQSEYLKIGLEIESPQHYASKIYNLDPYYGALSWSDIFLNSVDEIKGENLLKELINNNKKRPEAYLKLWHYYYYHIRDYAKSLNISENAFLNANSNANYSVVLSLNYARSLFKAGKVRSCLELLQLEYTKHSLFTVILYHYGRFCVKSKDQHFLGSAIGALEECLNTTSEARHGQIFYWLSKAYLQSEEKLEAFACTKKAIPILSCTLDKMESEDRDYERSLLRKLNELKDIMKDLHIHLISIEMLEKLLDEPPLKLDECKLYCSAVKEFDMLEGFIYEAKMWWKSGNSQKAKETLYSKLHMTRVKMKVYLLLVEFYENEGNYDDMLSISKEMVKKCRSPMIPVQVWIKANMIYAKCLIKQNKFHEAILVFKSLAQVQPIPFIPDVRYTRELQRACTREELDGVLKKISNNCYRYSYLSSNLADYQLQRSKLVCSKQFCAPVLLGEEEEDMEILSECTKAGSTDKSDSELVGNRVPEPLPKSKISSIPCGDSANIGFSVTTSYMFLYKIGRTCSKYGVFLEEGIHALHDFLNTHHYWTREGIEVHEEIKAKAKYWLGLLYYQTRQNSLANEVFRDIGSMLFQLGRTKMSINIAQALKDLSENQD